MTDDLDNLTDAELSERVAVECAGFEKVAWLDRKKCQCSGWLSRGATGSQFVLLPKFAISADAVLPLLERHTAELDHSRIADWHVRVYQGSTPRGRTGYDGTAPTFARAACIALLRAKRAEKGGAA